MLSYLYVGIFGLLGCLIRYGFGRSAAALGLAMPIATLAINILGSFLIGLSAGFIKSHPTLIPSHISTGLMAGLLGGFTTFSSFSLEMLTLAQGGRLWATIAYGLLSPILGLLAAFIGSRLA